MRCQKISYVPLKNQIRPGNNSERFVFLNQRHSREFLPLVLFSTEGLLGAAVSQLGLTLSTEACVQVVHLQM